MDISSAEKKQFQKKILDWYKQHKRDLPWRQTQDPYKILVSEVMLQQTQVPRVIEKFTRWMELWPSVQDVALAPRGDVLREWSWLGFNRRAINLHEACKKIADDSKELRPVSLDNIKNKSKVDKVIDWCIERPVSMLMTDYSYLRTLPWVGDYTANAVLAFAYNYEVPVMDINIKRVLLHSFQLPLETPMWELQELALSLVPHWQSCDWHNALMDYGSQVLHSKVTWIRSAKQSPFKWSDREVRGWIMKQIAKDWSIALQNVVAHWPQKDVLSIVTWLIWEWFIRETGLWNKKILQVNNWHICKLIDITFYNDIVF